MHTNDEAADIVMQTRLLCLADRLIRWRTSCYSVCKNHIRCDYDADIYTAQTSKGIGGNADTSQRIFIQAIYCYVQ
jgi:hypothetical protein